MILQQTVSIDVPTTYDKVERKARIQKWKDQDFIRSHSVRAAVKEMLQQFKNNEVVKVGIIGEQGTGKSSLARTIGHLAHKINEKDKSFPLTFREFGEKQYYDFEATINALEPAHYVLYFHDLSFLVERKKIDAIKNAVTKIRHLKEGFEAKILLIVDYHYTLALDKYLRQADFKFFTSLGSEEMQNMETMIGTKYKKKLTDFKNKYLEQRGLGTCTFPFKNSKPHIYNYKKPFVVCLFWNRITPRYIIFPLREWIDQICPTCSIGLRELIYNKINPKDFVNEGRKACGDRTFNLAAKLILVRNGIDGFPRSIKSAQKYIIRYLEKKQITLEDLAIEIGCDMTETRIKQKLIKLLEAQTQTTLEENNESTMKEITKEALPGVI